MRIAWREGVIAADDSAVRRIQAECSGLHALQTSASASRELPFVQLPPYLLSRVFFRHVPFVVDTYQYSQILVSTTKRRFTKCKSKSHLTKSRNQLALSTSLASHVRKNQGYENEDRAQAGNAQSE